MTLGTDLDRQRDVYRLLLEKSLQEAVAQLRLIEAVQRISVFGSFAQGKRDLFTDLDILIVMETDLGPVDRLRLLYSKVALPVDVDFVCYTPEEFERLGHTGWLKAILSGEQVMYEKRSL